MLKEFNYALEDEQLYPGSQNFKRYRLQLQERLRETNLRVINAERFLNEWLGPAFELRHEIEPLNMQVRDTDSQAIAAAIEQWRIEFKVIDIKLSKFYQERQRFIDSLIQWERNYRNELLASRSALINRLIDQSQYALNNKEPVKLELQIIQASTLFHGWSSAQPLYAEGVTATSITFADVVDSAKFLFLTALIILAIVRRNQVVGYLKKAILKRFRSPTSVKVTVAAINLIRSLYVFVVFAIFGYAVSDWFVGLGYGLAAIIRPISTHLLLFFLLLGLIKFITPYFSLRESRYKKSPQEVEAIEEVVTVVPLVILYCWLIGGFVAMFFEAFLHQSLLQFYSLNALKAVALVLLLARVFYKRDDWRLINDKATHSTWWRKITDASKYKFWEPVVLLAGAGIGVYRVMWSIFVDRITELEVARSFQAVVSRAILNRKYKRSTTRINASWFPDEYWQAFSYTRGALPEWYVARQEAEETLNAAYDQWHNDQKKSRVLIIGDRGIGKSEIIANFLRKKLLTPKQVHLGTGDTSIEAVCQRLSQELFKQKSLVRSDAMVDTLMAMDAQVICLENFENAMLRKVGGFTAMTWLLDVIIATSNNHFWIVTCTSFAWSIAKQAIPGSNSFTHDIWVQGMSEEQLTEMILTRHNDTSKKKPDFTQLNLKESSKWHKSHLDKIDLQERNRDLYFRILWDYTKGNPRQALYYWKASLSWGEFSSTVRLFDVPEQWVLENLSDHILMLLAALIEHNGLTIAGLAEVMSADAALIRRHMEEIYAFDIVFVTDMDGQVGYHVESFWARAVENYLLKRQFLFRGEEV